MFMAALNETLASSSVALELLIVEVVMFLIAILSYTLRIILKWRRRYVFGLDDILISLSLSSFTSIEVVRWYSKYSLSTHANESSDVQTLSRLGLITILYWSATATSQLSILWFYRCIGSGFSWVKTLLSFTSILIVSSWAAFTICDSLNLAYAIADSKPTIATPLLKNYSSLEIASMIFEPLCSVLILCVQLFRLNHISDNITAKPYLILIPISTTIVIITGSLRLLYFISHDIVSEMIWLQVHLGSSVLYASVPVYVGGENMGCMKKSNQIAPIEAWLRDIHSLPETSTISRTSKEIFCFKYTETDSIPHEPSTPTTRRLSLSSIRRSLSRRPLDISIRHGLTREILIEPDQKFIQQNGADLVLSTPSSKLEKATKRLMFEG